MYHAFISDGRLLIRTENGELREITSKFAKEKAEDAEQQRSLHGWKTKGKEGSPYFNADVVWGGQASLKSFSRFKFKTVTYGGPDTIYYLITNNSMTGLFKYSISEDSELRLFHRQEFHECGMDYSPVRDKFVAATGREDGSVGIELLNNEGKYEETITAGDSKDSNPSFSRKNPQEILYQTAGIARSDEGFIYVYSPEAINKIDLETGKITELLQDDHYDFLMPRDDAEGNVYCIRRPYKAPWHFASLRTLLYIIMFPIHLVIAIVRFLDAFVKLFGLKAQRPAGPNIGPEPGSKHLRVLGQTIDLAKIQAKAKLGAEPSLVGRHCELVKLTEEGQIEVVAKKVSSFDIDEEGAIHVTNGFRVNKVSESQNTPVFKHKIIEDLRIVAGL
ncbi:MAG: hypothetical protein ACYS8Z_18590 [Planctomycetota bacterium]|jgi:hypothetical protein